MIGAFRTLDDARWYWAAIATLALGAWIALWLLGASSHAGLPGHQASNVPVDAASPHVGTIRHDSRQPPAPSGFPRLAGFVLGWTFMTVAMMLPSSLPLLNLFRRTVTAYANRHRLLLLLVLGYLGAWAGVGVLAYLCEGALYRAVDNTSVFEAHGWMITPALLLVAGVYQYTPLKHMCLEKCRSPYAFLVEHWRGGQAPLNALRLGVRHGLFCVGCCWTLMLLMLAAGAAHLGWMLVLGGVMTAERATRWGR